MRVVIVTLFLTFVACFSTNLFATEIDAEMLQQMRIDSIKDYVRLLGHGNYQEIPKLFTDHAVAVSATGESDNISHFYQSLFLKKMTKPQARLINIFDGQLKNNMMTAYYNMTWINSDGIPVSKKFLDLFIFQADSSKIKTVYVFSNDFQESSFELEEKEKA